MSPDRFQDLYKLLRGNRAALVVLDSRTLFMEKKLSQSYDKLSEAREAFSESRGRVLRHTPEQNLDPKARDAGRQLKKLKRRQDKTLEALEIFDEMLPELEKMVQREQRRRETQEAREAAAQSDSPAQREASAPPDSPAQVSSPQVPQEDSGEWGHAGQRVARMRDLTDDLILALNQATEDQRLDLINQHFGFREVSSDADLHGDALYFVQAKREGILVCTPGEDRLKDSIQLINALDRRPIKPFSRDQFLKLGIDRKMVVLTCPLSPEDDEAQRDPEARESRVEPGDAASDKSSTGDPVRSGPTHGNQESSPPDDDASSAEAGVLDLGAFSQLLTSAQRSGLVPDADQIGYVRDREFRMGKHDLAFQAIETMFSRFMASAGQRTQRLAREDADIAAGRIQISPKDLQAKRARDRNQTQEIERAKRRFQVVLEGLRVLMNASAT